MSSRPGGLPARARAWPSVLLSLAVLSGCGVPASDQVTPIDPAVVPASPTATAHLQPGVDLGGSTPRLFFVVGEDALRAVRPRLPAGSTRQLATLMLQQLQQGPSPAQQQAGLSSAIPPNMELSLTSLIGNVAHVDLTSADPGPGGNAVHLIPAQIVLTLTSLPGIDEVDLSRNGTPLDAALPSGALTGTALNRGEYVGLLAG